MVATCQSLKSPTPLLGQITLLYSLADSVERSVRYSQQISIGRWSLVGVCEFWNRGELSIWPSKINQHFPGSDWKPLRPLKARGSAEKNVCHTGQESSRLTHYNIYSTVLSSIQSRHNRDLPETPHDGNWIPGPRLCLQSAFKPTLCDHFWRP